MLLGGRLSLRFHVTFTLRIKAIRGICHRSLPASLRSLAYRSVVDTKSLWSASHDSLDSLQSNRCFTLIRKKNRYGLCVLKHFLLLSSQSHLTTI